VLDNRKPGTKDVIKVKEFEYQIIATQSALAQRTRLSISLTLQA